MVIDCEHEFTIYTDDNQVEHAGCIHCGIESDPMWENTMLDRALFPYLEQEN